MTVQRLRGGKGGFGRFRGVPGLACFDLDTFLNMAKRSHKWQCPHSMRNMVVVDLQVDTYVSRLLAFLKVPPQGPPGPASYREPIA